MELRSQIEAMRKQIQQLMDGRVKVVPHLPRTGDSPICSRLALDIWSGLATQHLPTA